MSEWLGKIRFGLIDLARGTRVLRTLAKLHAEQWASPEQLRTQARSNALRHFERMKATVPFYARYSSFEDVPLLTKARIREAGDALINPTVPERLWVRKKTGGSTGEPLVYFTSRESQSYLWAGILLAWTVAGYRLGDRVAFVAGSAVFGDLSWKHRLYYRLMNADLYSAFDLSEATMTRYLDSMRRRKPTLMYGYAATIHRLARFAASRKVTVPSLRACVTTAEVLTPRMRADIEAAFGCKVFNQYGANDAGVSAFECPLHDGLHLIVSRCYPEVTPDGHLVTTDFTNDVMPLLRYDTGDLVKMAADACECGRGYPRIEALEGRANDCVMAPDGMWVHSEFFTHMFREDRDIARFQVLQRKDGSIEIRVEGDVSRNIERYQQALERRLGATPIEWKRTSEFVLTSGGKHRFVLSEMAQGASHSPFVEAEARHEPA